MPPKRKRHDSPQARGLAPGVFLKRTKLSNSDKFYSWSWVGTDVLEPSQISSEHRLATCGFSERNGHRICVNKYAPASKPAATVPPKKNETSIMEIEDEVIVISDDDNELPCSRTICKANPFCLNYLGQDKWEVQDDVERRFLKIADLGRDPMLDSRETDIPVGLKNLGATCYANASLQVWFRDHTFRAGVYGCQPVEGMQDKFGESPIFQLQVTFAALQKGLKKVYNPTKLVESLQLRTSEQQDAQEFSKLFMSHLDAEFKKQSIPALRTLITDQFQGEQIYGTRCEACGYQSERATNFLEIEINFEDNSNLEDQIRALLQEETLCGDNKYFCSQCDSLQDASRYTELRQLPPVIHFSLLRFIYDLKTMERKKSKHSITFPSSLDMSQFLGSHQVQGRDANPSILEDTMYELSGVLLHKGPSAYHGHYEAQVYDAETDSWYQFNDECVTKISMPGEPNQAKRSVNDSGSQEKARKLQPRGRRPKKRKLENGDDNGADKSLSIIPPMEGSLIFKESVITSKDAYMLIYTQKISASKRNLQLSAAESVAEPPPRAMTIVDNLNADHRDSCEKYHMRETIVKNMFQNVRQQVMNIYRSWDMCNITPASLNSVIVGRDALETWMSESCINSALERLNNEPLETDKRFTQTPTPLKAISSDAILCMHGYLDPNKAGEMKMITQRAYDSIERNTGCSFEPAPKPSEVCEACVESIFRERLYEIEHSRTVQRFEKICDDPESQEGSWISKRWLRDWLCIKPKMHVFSKGDPSPDSSEFVNHVRCEHGNLSLVTTNRRRISEEAAQVLRTLYPSWIPMSTNAEPCVICDALIHISKESKKDVRKRVEDEKTKLKHLHDSLTFGSDDNNCMKFAVIPTSFLKSWRKWLSSPLEQARPAMIDNSGFICEHERLVFDPNSPVDWDSVINIIRREDWDVMTSFYAGGPLISLERRLMESEEGEIMYDHEISVCEGCRLKRKSEWDTADIVIRMLGKSPSKGFLLSNRKATITYSSKSGARKSKRIREMKHSEQRRRFAVSKTTTLKELKIMIQEELKIPTICQQLSYRDQQLEDNEATIGELGIFSNDFIDLREDVEVFEINSDADSQAVGMSKREEGMGFEGTLLGTNDISSSGGETPYIVAKEKSCTVCTFSNPDDILACTACDTPFK